MLQIKSLIGETKGEKYFHPLLDVTDSYYCPKLELNGVQNWFLIEELHQTDSLQKNFQNTPRSFRIGDNKS